MGGIDLGLRCFKFLAIASISSLQPMAQTSPTLKRQTTEPLLAGSALSMIYISPTFSVPWFSVSMGRQ
jgi:hypothetical protein